MVWRFYGFWRSALAYFMSLSNTRSMLAFLSAATRRGGFLLTTRATARVLASAALGLAIGLAAVGAGAAEPAKSTKKSTSATSVKKKRATGSKGTAVRSAPKATLSPATAVPAAAKTAKSGSTATAKNPLGRLRRSLRRKPRPRWRTRERELREAMAGSRLGMSQPTRIPLRATTRLARMWSFGQLPLRRWAD